MNTNYFPNKYPDNEEPVASTQGPPVGTPDPANDANLSDCRSTPRVLSLLIVAAEFGDHNLYQCKRIDLQMQSPVPAQTHPVPISAHLKRVILPSTAQPMRQDCPPSFIQPF